MNDELYRLANNHRDFKKNRGLIIVIEWTIDWVEKCYLFSAIMWCCNKGRFQQMNFQKNSASPGSRHRDITVSALNVSRTSCKSQRWIETKFKVIPSWVSCGDINNNSTPHLGAPHGLCGIIGESNELSSLSDVYRVKVCQDFGTKYSTEKL